MENQIIKQAFRLGNSAGVLLPSSWKGRKVKIQLIEKSITENIIEILEEKNLLKNVIGIYLAGSYARGEEDENSDIDILIITDSINKQIKRGEYEIIMISKEKFENSIDKSLYIASLVNESKPILNNDYILPYKNKTKDFPTKRHIEILKSMMRINEKFVKLDEEMENNVSDETLYSIILRLREIYMLDCMKINKKPSKKEFLSLIKRISGSTEAYDSYIRAKNDKPSKEAIKTSQARSLISYIKNKINIFENGKKRKKT